MSSTAVWQLSLAFLTVPSGFFIVFVKAPRRSPRNSFVNPFSKQTINSALKSLERNGFITLTTGKDRRSKFLVLTEDGQELAARTVDLVIEQEQFAIASMGQESMKQFLSLFRIYTDALKQHFQSIAPESSAGDQQKENFYENSVI